MIHLLPWDEREGGFTSCCSETLVRSKANGDEFTRVVSEVTCPYAFWNYVETAPSDEEEVANWDRHTERLVRTSKVGGAGYYSYHSMSCACDDCLYLDQVVVNRSLIAEECLRFDRPAQAA